jgi:hypothetical protein
MPFSTFLVFILPNLCALLFHYKTFVVYIPRKLAAEVRMQDLAISPLGWISWWACICTLTTFWCRLDHSCKSSVQFNFICHRAHEHDFRRLVPKVTSSSPLDTQIFSPIQWYGFTHLCSIFLVLSHMFGYLRAKTTGRSRKRLVFLKSRQWEVSAHVSPGLLGSGVPPLFIETNHNLRRQTFGTNSLHNSVTLNLSRPTSHSWTPIYLQ